MKPLSDDDIRRMGAFFGPDAGRMFVNPKYHPWSPIIEIPSEVVGIPASKKIRIGLKLFGYALLHNLKSVPMFRMFDNLRKSGVLDDIEYLVLASSGGAAYSLGFIVRQFGKAVVAVVPASIAPGKYKKLRRAGVVPILHDESCGVSCIELADMIGQTPGCHTIRQYHSHENVESHLDHVIREMWLQTQGEVRVFGGSIGTGGHMRAAVEHFERMHVDFLCVAALAAEGSTIAGARPASRLCQIGIDAHTHIWQVEVSEDEAERMAEAVSPMATEDIGPSSAAAIIATRHALLHCHLDPLRNADGEVVAVVGCPDMAVMYPYKGAFPPAQVELPPVIAVALEQAKMRRFAAHV